MNGTLESEEIEEYRKQVSRASRLLQKAYQDIWKRDYLLRELRPLVGERAQSMIDELTQGFIPYEKAYNLEDGK